MVASRVGVAKDKTELVKALVATSGTTGPFQTYADVLVFAATLGAKRNKRLAVEEISRQEPAPISLEVFISRGYDAVFKLLALTETEDRQILSTFEPTAEERRMAIFAEYANGGLEILREELKGAVDYTERILLLLTQERFKEEKSETEFDLGRFLGN